MKYSLRLEIQDKKNSGWKTRTISDINSDEIWSVKEVLKLQKHLENLLKEMNYEYYSG